jgi:[ribosomal protein S18]-alanine N-acetyltransferase
MGSRTWDAVAGHDAMINTATTSDPAISLRMARDTDVQQLAIIERDAFSDPWPESAFRDFLDRPHARFTVAVDAKDQAIGYCVMLIMADEAEIANIAVAREKRRGGVAARLLDDAIASARQSHVAAMYLEVRTSNAPARALYESRLFRLVGRRRGYYQHPTEDALILRWTGGA